MHLYICLLVSAPPIHNWIHRRFLRFAFSVIASEIKILRLRASVVVCNKTSYFYKNINFMRKLYFITFENICRNTSTNKYTSSNNPENEKRAAFIGDLIGVR